MKRKFKLYKLYKLYKINYFIFFFLIFSFNAYSNIIQKDTILFNKLNKIKNLKEVYIYYQDSIQHKKNQISQKDLIHYFEKEVIKNTNNKNDIYINYVLVDLYKNTNQLKKAIDTGFLSYYKNVNNKYDDDILCLMLIAIENSYRTRGNSLGLIKINKEKLKICKSNNVVFYNIYSKMGLYKKAIESYKKDINYNSKNYNKEYNLFERAKHQNNFGVYHMFDKKYDSALYYYKKSNKLLLKQKQIDPNFEKRSLMFWIGLTKGNIGICYFNKKKYEEAIPLLLDDNKQSEIFYGSKIYDGIESTWYYLALCYTKTNQLNKAKSYIKKFDHILTYKYKAKTEFFTQSKNLDSALYYNQKYASLLDTEYKNKNIADKKELLNYFDFEDNLKSQEQKIFDLENLEAYQANQIKIITIASIILLAIFLMLLYNYIGKIKSQNIIETQKNEIETALTKNKILLKELNHRVKNNLQMVSSVLSLQANKIKDDNAKHKFKYSIDRIKVLSQIHNSLYNGKNNDSSDLLSYVNTLKNYLVKTIINPNVIVKFTINILPNIFINTDQKVTLGLIINELITNSFKYAFTEKSNNLITISIKEKEGFIYFNYNDNGIGLNLQELDKTKSIGFNLILRLVNQLGDEAKVASDKGMEISFKFKIKNS